MKKMVFLWIMVFAVLVMQAQSSQVKLYLQQIAANEVLIGYIQKGYNIAKAGLNTISDIKNGEFNLHRDFFASLKAINPKIKNSSIVADIIALQVKTLEYYKNDYKRIKESGQFTGKEINYIYSVFTRLLDNTAVTIEELLTLVTADKYQMSDGERIKRINTLYAGMQSNYVFVQHFGDETLLLSIQRMKEKQEVETSRALNGIAP